MVESQVYITENVTKNRLSSSYISQLASQSQGKFGGVSTEKYNELLAKSQAKKLDQGEINAINRYREDFLKQQGRGDEYRRLKLDDRGFYYKTMEIKKSVIIEPSRPRVTQDVNMATNPTATQVSQNQNQVVSQSNLRTNEQATYIKTPLFSQNVGGYSPYYTQGGYTPTVTEQQKIASSKEGGELYVQRAKSLSEYRIRDIKKEKIEEKKAEQERKLLTITDNKKFFSQAKVPIYNPVTNKQLEFSVIDVGSLGAKVGANVLIGGIDTAKSISSQAKFVFGSPGGAKRIIQSLKEQSRELSLKRKMSGQTGFSRGQEESEMNKRFLSDPIKEVSIGGVAVVEVATRGIVKPFSTISKSVKPDITLRVEKIAEAKLTRPVESITTSTRQKINNIDSITAVQEQSSQLFGERVIGRLDTKVPLFGTQLRIEKDIRLKSAEIKSLKSGTAQEGAESFTYIGEEKIKVAKVVDTKETLGQNIVGLRTQAESFKRKVGIESTIKKVPNQEDLFIIQSKRYGKNPEESFTFVQSQERKTPGLLMEVESPLKTFSSNDVKIGFKTKTRFDYVQKPGRQTAESFSLSSKDSQISSFKERDFLTRIIGDKEVDIVAGKFEAISKVKNKEITSPILDSSMKDLYGYDFIQKSKSFREVKQPINMYKKAQKEYKKYQSELRKENITLIESLGKKNIFDDENFLNKNIELIREAKKSDVKKEGASSMYSSGGFFEQTTKPKYKNKIEMVVDPPQNFKNNLFNRFYGDVYFTSANKSSLLIKVRPSFSLSQANRIMQNEKDKLKLGVNSLLNIRSQSKINEINRQELKINVSQKNKQENKQEQNNIQNIQNILRIQTKTNTEQKQNIVQKEKLDIFRNTSYKYENKTINNKIGIIKTTTKTIDPFIEPKTSITNKKDEKKRKKSLFGFDVLVRKKGKFFTIGTTGTFKSAIGLGSSFVGRTSTATFKIQRSNKIVGEEAGKGLMGNLSDFYRKGSLFIERRERRIKSEGEKREITYKGIKARRLNNVFK